MLITMESCKLLKLFRKCNKNERATFKYLLYVFIKIKNNDHARLQSHIQRTRKRRLSSASQYHSWNRKTLRFQDHAVFPKHQFEF